MKRLRRIIVLGVIASLAIVGKFIKNTIRDFGSNHRVRRGISMQ